MSSEGTKNSVFKWTAGWPCLDFANTKNWDSHEAGAERFKHYEDLVQWNYEGGTLAGPQGRQLRQKAAGLPADAKVVFEKGLAVRAEIHRIFSWIAQNKPREAVGLERFNLFLVELLPQAGLVPSGDSFAWDWTGEPDALHYVIWPAIWSATELLTSDKLKRVGQCHGDSCGWLFLDTSRNRSRRWCEMKHCGNRAKARRHYWRTRAAEA